MKFEITELPAPEVIDFRGKKLTRTHEVNVLHIAPHKGDRAVTIISLRGVMENGKFQETGDFQAFEMDEAGYNAMLADTTGGRKAGKFNPEEVIDYIAKRKAERDANPKVKA